MDNRQNMLEIYQFPEGGQAIHLYHELCITCRDQIGSFGHRQRAHHHQEAAASSSKDTVQSTDLCHALPIHTAVRRKCCLVIVINYCNILSRNQFLSSKQI